MRKRAKKLLALLTAVTVTVTGVNVPAAQAAAKPKAAASKTTLYYNGTKAQKEATVTVKNVKNKKVTYSISKAGKKIVTLGDISGKKSKKTKKFTVTAKKAGKATVTVKVNGKKVKKIKFTVEKKSSDTPKPTVAPTQAPTQEPTVAPTQEPTVAPSQEPTATPSEAPTETPEPEASRVTEIKITSTQALTSKDGKKAYVRYDVFDQYGKTMRESATINWSTAPANPKDDRTVGQLEFTKGGDDKFNYGDLIVITGVHPTTGVTVSEQVKVGLSRSLDTVEFKGFLGSDDATKVLETLPSTFASGTKTYSMLFKAFDQDGAPIDITDAQAFENDDVTFISDMPLKAGVDPTAMTVVTVKGEDYIKLPLTTGMQSDQGGTVTVTAIAQKTGTKTPVVVNIGSTGVLGSLQISAPTKAIYDGDQGVELSYVAKDTAGVETKDYKTIARSSNSLILNVTSGKIIISENDVDGTAKIRWYDDYQRTNSAADNYAYKNRISYDGIDRPVTISTVVVGGANSETVTLAVKDAPIPQKVVGSDKVLAGSSVDESWVIAKAPWSGADLGYVDMTIKSNYGLTMPAPEAYAFMKYAETNAFNGATYHFWKGDIDKKIGDPVYTDGKWSYPLNSATCDDESGKLAWTESFAIVAEKSADKSFCATPAKSSVTVVPVKDLNNVVISGIDKTIEYNVADSEDYSAQIPVPSVKKSETGTWRAYCYDENTGEANLYINVANTGASLTAGDKTVYSTAAKDYVTFTDVDTWSYYKSDWSGELAHATIADLLDLQQNKNSTLYAFRVGDGKKIADDDAWQKFISEKYDIVINYKDVNAEAFELRGCASDAAKYTVVGTYEGTELTVPTTYYAVSGDSQIDADNNIKANEFTQAEVVDLKNSNANYIEYKKFTALLELTLTDETGTPKPLKKNVSATLEAQIPTSISFSLWHDTGINEADGKNVVNTVMFAKSGVNGGNILDQYGYTVDGKTEFSVSNYKEATVDGLNFKSGVTISGNNQSKFSDLKITGAEIGDTFDLTLKVVGTNISATQSITVTADYYARITDSSTALDDALLTSLGKKAK